MSWEQWLSVIEEAKDLQTQELSAPPVCCPNDATPLIQGPDGQLWCPFDGWPNP